MPNWHTNAIAMHKDNVSLFVNDDGEVDFTKLKPMPKELMVPAGTLEHDAKLSLKHDTLEEFNENRYNIAGRKMPEMKFPFKLMKETLLETYADLQELGRKYQQNMEKYGATNWYDWCVNNWGCKWNACRTNVDTRGDIAIVTFQTAWAPPIKTLFTSVLEKTEHPHYVLEDYDEDYHGVSDWDEYGNIRKDTIIFHDTTLEDDNEDGNPYPYHYPDYDPEWSKISEKLGGIPWQ